MANLKSSLKDIKRNEANRLRNRSAKSAMKTYVKKALAAEGEAVEQAVNMAVKSIDKAAQRGIIHPNQAARRKSRLALAINAKAAAAK